jgi:hypothetical protein
LRADHAKEAARALRQENTAEALGRQEKASQDMERLAADLERAEFVRGQEGRSGEIGFPAERAVEPGGAPK